MSEMSIEAPDADSAEQDRDVVPEATDDAEQTAAAASLEADEADSAEQSRELGLDDDEYR
jgi:hypothetical protein